MLTEVFSCNDGTEYQLKTRLGWYDSQTIEESGQTVVFELDGKTLKGIGDLDRIFSAQARGDEEIDGVIRCELRMNEAIKNLARFKARLVNMNPRQIRGISRLHATQLLDRILELESEEQEEIDALTTGNPTTAS